MSRRSGGLSGGYFAKRAPAALQVVPITDTAPFAPLVFRYAIAMGVRKNDTALRNILDAELARNTTKIRSILSAYGIPLVNMKAGANG